MWEQLYQRLYGLLLFYPFFQPQFWPYMLTTILALAVLVNGRRYPWLFGGLGGFLLGQVIGKLALPGWDLNVVFWFSAALGVLLGGLTLVAQRPLVTVASFLGVGYLAFVLCEILGIGDPWNLIAYAVAGGVAVAALFLRWCDRALAVNVALAVAGAIVATLAAWIVYFETWNDWPAVVIGAIAAVVGIVHQFRQLPAPAMSPQTVAIPQHAGPAAK